MRIRRAAEVDAYAIARVHEAAIRAVTVYTPEQIESWAANIAPVAYLPYMAARDFFVAVDDSGVVGFAELNADAAEIGAVYVDPARQRRGIGRDLVATLEEAARQRGLVQLKVIAALDAVAFYSACGYVTRERASCLTREGVEMECAVMSRTLPKKRQPPQTIESVER